MGYTKINYLYKYRPLINYSSKEKLFNEFTLDLIKKGELHFSSPLDFNDPFDSLLYLEDKYENYLSNTNSVESRFNRKKNNTTWNDLIDKTWNELSNESWENINTAYSVSDLRVFCVSKSYKNILMWSHYADSHKGVCVGFDFSKKPLIINKNEYVFEEVKYDDRNKIDDIDLRMSSLLYKFKDWKYENEFRLILDNSTNFDKNYNLRINVEFIKEIVFGILTPIKYIGALINELYNSDYKNLIENENLQFYQMKRNFSTYEITKNKLDVLNYITK